MRLELEQIAPAFPSADMRGVVGPTGMGNGDFDKALADGVAAAQSGNRAQARILLQHAVELDPQSEAGWLWLSSISEYPEELLAFLDHVLAINPRNGRAQEWKTATNQLMAKTFVQRGIDASKQGRNDLAMQCFNTAIFYDEQNQLAWFWKDSLSKNASDEPTSLEAEDFDSLLAGKKSVAAIILEAETTLADGDRQRALVLADEAIDTDPASEKAWLLRSHLVDGFEEKRDALHRVVEINPENQTARAALETLLATFDTGAPERAHKRESATERILNSPFDQVAQPIDGEHENFPTQELELPDAIKENNPFVSDQNPELPADVQGTVVGVQPEHEEYENVALSEDHNSPSGKSPESGSNPFFQQEDWDNYDERVQELENYSSAAANDPSLPESDPALPNPVQEISAAAYLEETDYGSRLPAVDENYLNSPSWQDHHDEDNHRTDEEDPVWVIDESEVLEVHGENPASAKTILVVDDSPVVRKLIAGKLEESGYNVISAGSGAEAMTLISNSAPDLVLLDIAMPKMDGYQVCENIRKNVSTKDVPVVLISGKDGYYDEDRAQKAGTSSFISKPFGPETLMRAMETYLPSV